MGDCAGVEADLHREGDQRGRDGGQLRFKRGRRARLGPIDLPTEFPRDTAYRPYLKVVRSDDVDNREVGVWGVGDLNEWWMWPNNGDLPNAVEAARRFYNELVEQGFTGKYAKYNEENVSEKHFEKESYGGEDYIYADDCDFIYVRTHGDVAEFITGSSPLGHYDRVELYEAAEWGDLDMEWAFISACKILGGASVANAFANGFHGLCGYHSVAYDVLNDGYYFARYATGLEGGGPAQ